MKATCLLHFRSMRSWILTGGVACGKSSAKEALHRLLGSAVVAFSSDEEVARLLDQPDVTRAIVAAFGREVVSKDSQKVDRAWLRQRVFGDAKARKRLEKILHPKVLTGLEDARAKAAGSDGKNLFLAEVPLHYEIGTSVSADLVIVVAASRAVQVRRLMERRGLDESIIEQMLRSQWPIEAKVERADVVIWNDGDPAAFESQVLTLARQHWHE